jgi:hypothetical protein
VIEFRGKPEVRGPESKQCAFEIEQSGEVCVGKHGKRTRHVHVSSLCFPTTGKVVYE